MTRVAPAVALFDVLAVLAALVAAPAKTSVVRAAAAILLSLASAGVAWTAPEDEPFWRSAIALGGFLAFAGVLDVVRDRPRASGGRGWPAAHRVLRVLFFFDVTLARRVPRAFDSALFFGALGYAAIAVVAFFGVLHASAEASRLAAGLVFVYVGPDIATRLLRLIARWGFGLAVPPLHRTPLASRTVREFWGERWNRPVGAWLRFHFFKPLARRGMARTGLFAAFVASATLHAYFTLVSAGGKMAALMFAFFVTQGVLVMLESILRVGRWRAASAHVWTIATMLAVSPLFTEPMLRSVGL